MNISVGIHEDAQIAQTIRELALEGYKVPGRPEHETRGLSVLSEHLRVYQLICS